MATEKIKIVKIGRKQQPSKFKPGETYSITTIMDDENRKMAAMGKWADGGKIGDVIEAEVESKTYTDKDGFQQTSLNLKNPNPSSFSGKGGFGVSIKTIWSNSYTIAASLAPLIFAFS